MKPPNQPKPPARDSGPHGEHSGPGLQVDADIVVSTEGTPTTRTTASEGHSCEQCGNLLTGRKTLFCSDACRMRNRRLREAARRDQLLRGIEQAVSELREMETRHG